MTNVKSIVLGNSVTTIGENAFSNCTLTSIEIPNSVKSIGSYSFQNCSNLKAIEIPNSVQVVGYWAFSNCSNLESVIIGNSVSLIGTYAFMDCTNLKNVELGNSLKTIQNGAFYCCSNLTSIEIPKSVEVIESGAFSGCSSLSNLVILDAVTSIGSGAFSPCENLENVEFGNYVTSIDSYAFKGCNKLVSLIIPNSVTSIGEESFKDCTNIQNIEIPNSVAFIGQNAFEGCVNIEKVNIDCTKIDRWFPTSSINEIIFGDHVTEIGTSAFSWANIKTLDIPNSVTTIGNNAFQDCSNLVTVDIHNSVTTIGNNAFQNCSNLVDIDIPNSVTSIGQYAFSYCTKAKSLIIPNSINNIGLEAFSGCDNLETIYSLITKVFTIDEHAFSEIVFNNANLYVPKGKLATYQGTNYWSKFLNIHEGAPTEIGDLDRSYKLKVSDAGMATMYLDYPIAIPDNDNMLGVFYVCSMNDHILNLRRLKETIPANCGVIVMANQGTFTFKETLMSTEVVEENMLTGTTKKVNVTDISGDVYTLGRGKNSGYMGFHKYTGATLPAYKAYLVMNDDEEEDDVLVIDRDSYADIFDATNISFVVDEEDAPIIYDLQGRRVDNPSKGIYIVNGKKVYIK